MPLARAHAACPVRRETSVTATEGHYQLDVEQGRFEGQGSQRVVAVPAEVLRRIVSVAVQCGDLTSLRYAGHMLAETTSVAGDEALSMGVSEVLGLARRALALAGWGSLEAERWGKALTLVLRDAPTLDADQLGIAALLGGLFSTLAKRDVACVPMDEERYLCVAPALAEPVWNWSKAGRSLYSVLAELDGAKA